MARPSINRDLAWYLARGVRDGSGCLLWPGKRDRNGYGVVTSGKKELKVHREVFALLHGTAPEAVCHRCDTPACFDPFHLWGGTKAENNRDMAEKGRAAGRPKLERSQALEIRRRRLAGESPRVLAAEYGVSRSTICDIAKGRSWKDHPGAQPGF